MAGLIDLVQTLTTPHTLDRYLELVRPTLTVRDMRAEIVEVDRRTPGSITLTLRPTRQWRGHLAGQYVQIGVLIDGVKHTRCYSPIDPQGATRRLRLTVKAHPHGLVSRYLHRHAAPGMVVDLAPAAGVFTLPQRRPDGIVLISGGSGITPVLSILRTLDAENHRGPVVFLHYAHSPEAVPHRVELAEIAERHNNFRIALCYPRLGRSELLDGAPWSCAKNPVAGLFGYDQLERIAPWFATAQTYVCGPAPLMTAVRTVYQAEQLDDRLHREEFTLAAAPVDPGEITGVTTFSASATTVPNAGATLLEQAESAGLTPEYGCRMGICFSCTSIKRSGCTRNLRTGELDSDPDQPIQLCINAAVGDVDIEI
ncbi:ferredoxin reductase [Nocardia sp. NEAU-G5]|uniref:Ferredoxin reductase n=1 Tax=Nocardia albiluteola TaxID=2842303 RepID=A0ABS6B5G3_9NOCA|nr:FAD-binding oxidoreductase [Nocardia albiluteola]MBU3062612.1 ferredoxin reductase [Nocardia albiluteola]MBU3065554.1 ferredoxin reductase [Nocardia albiluteola]